ncbi:MAG: RluA family pseudouridine synthase [Syntrophobacteraceae bacterium]
MSEGGRGPRLPGRLKNSPGVEQFRWLVGFEQKGLALVKVVSDYLLLSEEDAIDLIGFGSVYVRGQMTRDPTLRLCGGEEIWAAFPSCGIRRFYEIDPSHVIFRDRFLLAYDKEANIASQQVPFDAYNNVFAALLRFLSGKKGAVPYAGLHHRLDMETSGLLLFALERKANEPLARAFRERKVKKQYLAWVEGFPQRDFWTCEADIGKVGGKYKTVGKGEGKEARTLFNVLSRKDGRSLVLAVPLTGRTHQIRIHLALGGHPIAGDRAYGAKPDQRLFLHAWRLTLKHPVSGNVLNLQAPVPAGWPEVVALDSL